MIRKNIAKEKEKKKKKKKKKKGKEIHAWNN